MKKNPIMIGVLALALMLTLSACGTKNDSENLNGTDSSGATDNNPSGVTDNTSVETPAAPASEATNSPMDQTATATTTTDDLTRVIAGQKDLFKDYNKAIIKTSEGDIEVQFYPETPVTVNNFLNLAQNGFYDGTKFHRIMKDFMIQGGDPLTKDSDTSVYGTGGPGYKFKNENSDHKLVAGNIAMANAGVDTNGSQFFIVTATSTPFLDGSYTNFGEVISGMEVVRKIENSAVKQSPSGEMSAPIDYVTVKSVQIEK